MILFSKKIIYQPIYIFFITFSLVLIILVYDSTAMALWKLSKKRSELSYSIEKLKKDYEDLNKQIKKAHTPEYIEKEAIDRLNLLKPKDLLIVFSE